MQSRVQIKSSIAFPIYHPFYQLAAKETRSMWMIELTVSTYYINTKTLPSTFTILSKYLPSIFYCDCYNDDHTPFHEELKHTELGHLFEHMLLEYLCMERIDAGHGNAEFSGRTSWNWVRETRGKFHIKIHKSDEYAPYFIQAIKKSISLLNLILYSSSDRSYLLHIN